jgi:hypothetical protein
MTGFVPKKLLSSFCLHIPFVLPILEYALLAMFDFFSIDFDYVFIRMTDESVRISRLFPISEGHVIFTAAHNNKTTS